MCTVGFGLIAVCSFYGIWEVEEVYYQNRQGFNDTLIEEFRGKNSWDCVVCKIKINDYCSYLYACNTKTVPKLDVLLLFRELAMDLLALLSYFNSYRYIFMPTTARKMNKENGTPSCHQEFFTMQYYLLPFLLM